MTSEEMEAALERLLRFQDTLPPSWREEWAYDLDDPEDYRPMPDRVANLTIDMREVLDSWRDQPESPGPLDEP